MIKVFSTIAVEFSTYIAGRILFVSVVKQAKDILQLLIETVPLRIDIAQKLPWFSSKIFSTILISKT